MLRPQAEEEVAEGVEVVEAEAEEEETTPMAEEVTAQTRAAATIRISTTVTTTAVEEMAKMAQHQHRQ